MPKQIKKKTQKIEVKNQSDSLIYQTKKQLEELDSKISADDKTNIESLLADLDTAIKNEAFDEMKSLNEKIKKGIMDIGQKVYNQNGSNPSDDVIETDFSMEK